MSAARQQQIAQLFIRIQHCRDRAWQLHIRHKTRPALEQAALMEMAAIELRTLLGEEEEAAQQRAHTL